MALQPRYAIKSDDRRRYLLCTADDALKFTGEQRMNENATFQLMVVNGHPDLVNIKSSNGKYWKRIQNSDYIHSIADAPDDENTFFKIVRDESNNYRIFHEQSRKYIEPDNNDRAQARSEAFNERQIVVFQM